MPSWFDQEVAELERRTRTLQGRPDQVLFYGSSSFTLWSDLDAYFPGYATVNHGFGGSTLADCVEYFERLVVPIRPRVIVLYAGDNDLGNGGSPEAVLASLRRFVRLKREHLGRVPMAFVSIKISPARFHIMHKIAYTNRLLQRDLADEVDARFVDITRRMVGRGLQSFLRYYTHDPLHMNREGYRVLGKSIDEYLAGVRAVTGDLRGRGADVPPAWLRTADEITEAAA